MSQIANPHYLIKGPFGIYGPGWPNGPPSALGFQPPPGLQGWGGGGVQWPIQPTAGYGTPGPSQQAQAQTPNQAQQSEQPAPRRPAQTPSPNSGTYGYRPTGAYTTASVNPSPGVLPQSPAYFPPPQPLPAASAPAAPSLVSGQPSSQAPRVAKGPSVMTMPAVNPLHAAIQSHMTNNTVGIPSLVPYLADPLNGRYPRYQTS